MTLLLQIYTEILEINWIICLWSIIKIYVGFCI